MLEVLPKADARPRTRVIADIDYDKAGKQFGYLRVPNSNNDSAWGAIAIPIIVIKNGKGPTLLLTAGTHGDEYEGQIVLHDLARLQLGPRTGATSFSSALVSRSHWAAISVRLVSMLSSFSRLVCWVAPWFIRSSRCAAR